MLRRGGNESFRRKLFNLQKIGFIALYKWGGDPNGGFI